MDGEATAKLVEALARAGVAHFKSTDFEVTFRSAVPDASRAAEVPFHLQPNAPANRTIVKAAAPSGDAGAVEPVESKIPHHINEVASLLKLSDNELAERLFPDYTREVSEPIGGE